MRGLRLLALATLVSGCNPDLIPGGVLPDGATKGPLPGPGGDHDLAGLPNPGSDGGGMMANPCPEGQHLEAMKCLPDEFTCAEEFPCPGGFVCKGGHCIQLPGPCGNNDDCPVGHLCINGNCVPQCPNPNPQCMKDADCKAAEVCIGCACVPIDMCKKPTPDLSGAPWQAHQILHLDEALSGFGGIMVGILKKLRDGILGCPKGSAADCFLYEIIAQFLPQWSKTLIVALGNFGDLIDNHNFLVDSEMTFKKNGKPQGYSTVDHWQWLTFSYQNMIIHKKPEDIAQIGKPVFVNFESSAICGILYVEKHKIEGVLSGILKWIVDTFVEIQTKGQYKTLGEAIDGAIDCSKVQDLAAKAACFGFTKGLKQQIDDALNKWLLSYSLMTLKGTATVASGTSIIDGKWDGTLGSLGGLFKNFTGEWTAKR